MREKQKNDKIFDRKNRNRKILLFLILRKNDIFNKAIKKNQCNLLKKYLI